MASCSYSIRSTFFFSPFVIFSCAPHDVNRSDFAFRTHAGRANRGQCWALLKVKKLHTKKVQEREKGPSIQPQPTMAVEDAVAASAQKTAPKLLAQLLRVLQNDAAGCGLQAAAHTRESTAHPLEPPRRPTPRRLHPP